ncbi:hypothetical protein OC844_002506 [Tilletia horrida]|nr:hypothetical protein OC844_002506 [Tilletia horrida]
MQPFPLTAAPLLACALLLQGTHAVRFTGQGTFSPDPSISSATTLTNSQAACVEFGSCSTATGSGIITETYAPGVTSLSNIPSVVAPTDAAQSSSYQASLAAAGASSIFSSLSSSRDAASSSSSSAAAAASSSTTSSNSTGAAAPVLAAHGVAAAAGLVAFGAVFLAA